jgi:hypothetical protein
LLTKQTQAKSGADRVNESPDAAKHLGKEDPVRPGRGLDERAKQTPLVVNHEFWNDAPESHP